MKQHYTPSEIIEMAEALRQQLGLSQQDVADQISEIRGKPITQQAVAQGFAGRPANIKAIALWFQSRAMMQGGFVTAEGAMPNQGEFQQYYCWDHGSTDYDVKELKK